VPASHLECLPVFPLVAMHSEKSAYAELKKLVGWPRCLTPVSGPGVWMPEAVWPEAGWVAPTWALLLALHSENSAYTELKKLVGWPRCLAPVSGCPRLSGLKLGGLKLGGWHLSSRHLRGNDGACDTGFPPARSRFCGIFPTKCPEPAKLADFACGV